LTAEDFSYKGKLTKYSKGFEARDYNARGWASLLAGGAGVASALAPVFGGGTTKPTPKPTGKLPDIPGPWSYKGGPLSR
jgi:hypothetical protein